MNLWVTKLVKAQNVELRQIQNNEIRSTLHIQELLVASLKELVSSRKNNVNEEEAKSLENVERLLSVAQIACREHVKEEWVQVALVESREFKESEEFKQPSSSPRFLSGEGDHYHALPSNNDNDNDDASEVALTIRKS